MRIAIVSDIHGNLAAFEAVLADLAETAPDLIVHGGDLTHGGSSSAGVVDRIRELGWDGVAGNTDEMLFDPQSLTAFAAQRPNLKAMFDVIAEMAAADREGMGEERLAWLRCLPREWTHDSVALVHASPASLWLSPAPEASDEELESTYGPLGHAVGVYGHVHRPYIRKVAGMVVVNSGSVSLSYDGDRRAAYLLLDEGKPSIRRVEYDVDKEVRAMSGSRLPHWEWIAKILETARPQMP